MIIIDGIRIKEYADMLTTRMNLLKEDQLPLLEEK